MSIEQQFESVILQLLKERGSGKTICPSEAARIMAKLDGKPECWRDWLEQARATAIHMSKQGQVAMLQHGKKIDPDKIKGPIRLQLIYSVST